MKDEPWSPPHILKGDDLMSGPITCSSKYVNYTFTYDPSLAHSLNECTGKTLKAHPYSLFSEPFGIDYWLTKSPSLIGRLKKFLSRLNPISKEKRMSTKKKLRTKIKNLEYNVEIQKEAIEGWEKAYADYVKKYKALQQAICYLSEKAEIIQIEKDVFAPKPFTW